MYVPDKLWRGEISPTDCYFRQGSIYQQTAEEVCSRMDVFLPMLTPEAKEYLEAINDLKGQRSLFPVGFSVLPYRCSQRREGFYYRYIFFVMSIRWRHLRYREESGKELYNGPLVKTTLEEIIVNTF